MAQSFRREDLYTGLAWMIRQPAVHTVVVLLRHQIVKGQWFVTVKVRNDPGPRLPETELGMGVGFSDGVVVVARVAKPRLREQNFILVEEMGVSLQAVP